MAAALNRKHAAPPTARAAEQTDAVMATMYRSSTKNLSIVLLVIVLSSTSIVQSVVAGTWVPRDPSGPSPTGRRDHDCAYISKTMDLLCFGGTDTANVLLRDTQVFSLVNHQWKQHSQITDIPQGRSGHNMVSISTTEVVVFGGRTSDQAVLDDIWKFTVDSGWSLVATTNEPPDPRTFSSTVYIPDQNKIFIFGGDSGNGATLAPLDDAWFLDVATWSWEHFTSPTKAPWARAGHSANLFNNQVWIFGGLSKGGALNDMWSLNLATNKWQSISAVSNIRPAARAFQASVVLGISIIYSGGESEDLSSETWRWDPYNYEWVLLAPVTGIPLSISHHSFTRISDTVAASFGGVTLSSIGINGLRELERHSTDARWASIVPSFTSPTGRVGFVSQSFTVPRTVAAISPSSPASPDAKYTTESMWILGGESKQSPRNDDVWEFDIDTSRWTQHAISSGPTPGPHAHAQSAKYAHFIVVAGGGTTGSGCWALNTRSLQWTMMTSNNAEVPLTFARAKASHIVVALQDSIEFVSFFGNTIDENNAVTTTIHQDVVSLRLDTPVGVNRRSQMLRFNGETSFITAWEGRQVAMTNGFTVAVWFQLHDANIDGQTLLAWGPGSGDRMRLFFDYSSGCLCVAPYNPAEAASCGSVRVDDTMWHLAVVAFSPVTSPASGQTPTTQEPLPASGWFSRLYVDGALDTLSGDVGVSTKGITVSDLIIGAFFPPSLPYVVGFRDVVSGLVNYQYKSSIPYFKGHMDDVSAYLGVLDWDQVTKYGTAALPYPPPRAGCWKFDDVTVAGQTDDCDPSLHAPAQLGILGRTLTRPTLLGSNRPTVPAPVGSPMVWSLSAPRQLWTAAGRDVNAAGNTYPQPTTSSSAVGLGTSAFVYGGLSANGPEGLTWEYDFANNVWTKINWALPNGVVDSMGLALTIKAVPIVAFIGGRERRVVSGIEKDASDVSVSARMVNMRNWNIATNVITIGHGLSTTMYGLQGSVAGNGSAVLLFGGLVDGVYSSQVYWINTDNAASLDLIRITVSGNAPRFRISQPAAVKEDTALFFGGRINKDVLWSLDIGSSEWAQATEMPYEGDREPGFALASMNGTIRSLGEACDTFDPLSMAANERCAISNAVYTHDVEKQTWNRTQYTSTAPDAFTPQYAQGGVSTLYAELCGYPGNAMTCQPAPFHTSASTDSATSSDENVHVAKGINGQWLSVWSASGVSGVDHDIMYSFSNDGGGTWGDAMTLNTNAATDAGNDVDPHALYVAGHGWIVTWSSTDPIWGGVDADIFVAKWPHADTYAWCDKALADAHMLSYLPDRDTTMHAGIKIAGGTADSASDIMAVFSSRRYNDSDIFFTRSLDGGVSWATVMPVQSYARMDDAQEDEPTLAYVGNGTYIAAWPTRHGSGSTNEADIAVSVYPAPATTNTNLVSGTCGNPNEPMRMVGWAGTFGLTPYSDGSSCLWTVDVNGAKKITVTFSEFVTNASDTLTLYDGPSTSSPVIGSPLVGRIDMLAASYSSTGQSMTLRFVADATTSNTGFKAAYTAVQGTVPREQTFSAPMPANDQAHTDTVDDRTPFLVAHPDVAPGSAWLFWSTNGADEYRNTTSDYDIVVSMTQDHGASWSANTLVDPLGTRLNDDSKPAAAWARTLSSNALRDRVVVVWERAGGQTGDDADIYWSFLQNDRTWKTTAILNTVWGHSDNFADMNPVVATNKQGNKWVVVWQSTSDYRNSGNDFDLFYIVIDGDLESNPQFSDPQLLNTNGATDLGDDVEPKISVSGDGTWTVIWRSKESLLGVTGLDYDVMLTESTDGTTWTSPRALNPTAQSDHDDDIGLALLSSTTGNMRMAAWACCGGNSVLTIDKWTGTAVVPGSEPACPDHQRWSQPNPLNSNADTDIESDIGASVVQLGNNKLMAVWQASTNKGNATALPPTTFAGTWLQWNLRSVVGNLAHDASAARRDGVVRGDVSMVSVPRFQGDVTHFGPQGTGNIAIETTQFPTRDISIAGWLRADPTQPLGTIASFASVDSYETFVVRNNGDEVVATEMVGNVRSTITLRTFAGQHVNDGLWHHFAVSWTLRDYNLAVFVDGKSVNKTTFGSARTVTAAEGVFVLGQSPIPHGAHGACLRQCFQSSRAYKGDMAYWLVLSRLVFETDLVRMMDFYSDSVYNLHYAMSTNGLAWEKQAVFASGGTNTDVALLKLPKEQWGAIRVFAVWSSTSTTDGSGHDADIFRKYSDDNGVTWSATTTLTAEMKSDSGDDFHPRLSAYYDATTNGEAVVVVWNSDTDYNGLTGTDHDIWFARSFNGGGEFEWPRIVNTNAEFDSGDDIRPDVAVDGSNIWMLAWQGFNIDIGQRPGTGWEIVTSRCTNCGATDWLVQPEFLPSRRMNDFMNDGDDTRAMVVPFPAGWGLLYQSTGSMRNTLGSDSDILWGRTPWNTPRFICRDPVVSDTMRVAPVRDDYIQAMAFDVQNSGVVVAIFTTIGDKLAVNSTYNGTQVWVQRSEDRGVTFKTPARIKQSNDEFAGMRVASPSIATNRNQEWRATWVEYGVIGTQMLQVLRTVTSTTEGRDWTSPTTVYSVSVPVVSYPRAMLSPSISTDRRGAWIIVWSGSGGSTGNDKDIMFSMSTVAVPSWTSPTPLARNAAHDSGDDNTPRAEWSDGLNAWVAVWSSEDKLWGAGTDSDLYVSYKPHGDAYIFCPSSPARAHTNATVSNTFKSEPEDISVAFGDGGEAFAVWSGKHNGQASSAVSADSDVYFSRSYDDGVSWGVSHPVWTNFTGDTSVRHDVSSVVDFIGNGTFGAVWQRLVDVDHPATYEVHVAITHREKNETFLAPTVLSTSTSLRAPVPGAVDMAADRKGGAFIVWNTLPPAPTANGGSATSYGIAWTKTTTFGETWSTPTMLNTGDNPTMFPRAAWNQNSPRNTVVVVWQGRSDRTGVDWDIFYARSSDGGATWSTASPLNSNAATDVGSDMHPSIAVAGSSAGTTWVVAWQSDDTLGETIGHDSDILWSVSQDDGVTWRSPAAVNRNAGYDRGDDIAPRVSVQRLKVFTIAWKSNDNYLGVAGHDYDIMLAESPDGTRWGPQRTLSDDAYVGNGDAGGVALATAYDDATATKRMAVWSCCKGDATQSLRSEVWSGSWVDGTCPNIDEWSHPTALSPDASIDGTAQDTQPALAGTNGGDSKAAVVWSSDSTQLKSRAVPHTVLMWDMGDALSSAQTLLGGNGAALPDRSGHGHNATVSASVWGLPDVSFPRGVALLDGTLRSTINYRGSVMPEEAVTIAVWVKVTSQPGAAGTIFSVASSQALELLVDGFGSRVVMDDGVGNGVVMSTPNARIDDGTWRHWALSWSSSTAVVTVYVDGVARHVGTVGAVGRKLRPAVGITIGHAQTVCVVDCLNATAALTNARVGAFAVFDRVLTGDDMLRHAMILNQPPLPMEIGGDLDILSSRLDTTFTWSAPTPANTNANVDVGDDTHPTIVHGASSGDGWASAWISNDGMGTANLAGDADVFLSSWDTTAKEWKAPAVVNQEAKRDHRSQHHAAVRRHGDGALAGLAVSGFAGDSTIDVLYIEDPTLAITPPSTLKGSPECPAPQWGQIFIPALPASALPNAHAASVVDSGTGGSVTVVFEATGPLIDPASPRVLRPGGVSGQLYFAHGSNSGFDWDTKPIVFGHVSNTGFAMSPVIARNKFGVEVIVYSDAGHGAKVVSIYTASRRSVTSFDTTAWSAVSEISSEVVGSAATQEHDLGAVVVPGALRSFLAVWRSQPAFNGKHAVWFSRSLDGVNQPWSPQKQLFVAGSKANTIDRVTMASGAETVIVVWDTNSDAIGSVNTGPDYDIAFARSTDNGLTWSTAMPVAANARADSGNDQHPHIATNGLGRWVIVWTSDDTLDNTIGRDFDILYIQSADDGVTWSSPTALNSNAAFDVGNDTAPFVEMRHGSDTAIVAWGSNDALGNALGNDDDILFALTYNAGVTWTRPEPVLPEEFGTDTLSDHRPSLAAVDDGWYCMWEETSETEATTLRSATLGSKVFLKGDFVNRASTSAATMTLSSFGGRITVLANQDTTRRGFYSFSADDDMNVTARQGKVDIRYMDQWANTRIPTRFETFPALSIRLAFAESNPVFSPRWATGRAVVPEGAGRSLLMVHGGTDREGTVAAMGIVSPYTSQWEEVVCDGGTTTTALASHSIVSFTTAAGVQMLLIGAPHVASGDHTAEVTWLSDLRHTPESSAVGRASVQCRSPAITGTPPMWTNFTRTAIFNSHVLVLDTTMGGNSNNGIFDLDISSVTGAWAWSIVPGIPNAGSFSGMFSSLVQSGRLFVIGVRSETVEVQMVNLERDSPELSTVGGANLLFASTGQTAVVDVTARTAFGDPSSGEDLSVELAGATRIRGQQLRLPVARGVYRFIYVANQPGIYSMRVLASGGHVHGSPFNTEISPGETSLTQSLVISSTISSVVPGLAASFAINARDIFGNMGLGGDDISVLITRAELTWVAGVKDNVDGTYTVDFTLTQSGNYQLGAMLGGLHLPGSPMPITVNPGEPVPANAIIWGDGIGGAASSGQGTNAMFRMVDAFGNNVTTSSAEYGEVVVSFFADLAGSSGRRMGKQDEIIHPATFVAKTHARKIPKGLQDSCVATDGPGCKQFSSIARAGPTVDQSPSTRRAPPPRAGLRSDGHANANRREFIDPSRIGDPVERTVIKPSVIDNEDGTYTVGYFSFTSGDFIFKIELAGVPIAASPYTVNIKSVSSFTANGEETWQSRLVVSVVCSVLCIGAFFNPTVMEIAIAHISRRMKARKAQYSFDNVVPESMKAQPPSRKPPTPKSTDGAKANAGPTGNAQWQVTPQASDAAKIGTDGAWAPVAPKLDGPSMPLVPPGPALPPPGGAIGVAGVGLVGVGVVPSPPQPVNAAGLPSVEHSVAPWTATQVSAPQVIQPPKSNNPRDQHSYHVDAASAIAAAAVNSTRPVQDRSFVTGPAGQQRTSVTQASAQDDTHIYTVTASLDDGAGVAASTSYTTGQDLSVSQVGYTGATSLVAGGSGQPQFTLVPATTLSSVQPQPLNPHADSGEVIETMDKRLDAILQSLSAANDNDPALGRM